MTGPSLPSRHCRLLPLLVCVCLSLVAILAMPARAQDASAAMDSPPADPLDAVSRHLNGISTLETDFTQYNANGSISTGRLYIQRPGRMRMEYDANGNGALMIVGAGTVSLYDTKTDGHGDSYPLARTPLGPILERTVDLRRAEEVQRVSLTPRTITVLVQDPARPELGYGWFTVERSPMRLASWTMVNEAGQTTKITFSPQATVGHDLSNLLFSRHFHERRLRGE